MQTIFTETLEQAFAQAGLNCPKINGHKITRFSTNGSSGDTAGWLRIFDDETGAAFGDWRTGDMFCWQLAKEGQQFSDVERAAFMAKVAEQKLKAEAEREQAYADAAQQAQDYIAECSPANAHPYLERKQINACGALLHGDMLVIPVTGPNGVQTLQRIDADGSKKFMPGGRAKAGSFTIGEPTDTIVITEGFATGASIHMATGLQTVVAFSASNLVVVAKLLRISQRGASIVIAGDNDEAGIKFAEAAANAVGGRAVFPLGVNDFNDMACADGLEMVANLINPADAVFDEMLNSYDYTTDRLKPIEFCVDGFLSNKVTVIAGPPGVGKTSLLVPMACVSAGLVSECGIKASLRRRVAYVTEDPEQVERILFGMRKHGLIDCTDEEFRYWFDVIPAMRAGAEKVGNFVNNLRKAKNVKAPAEQNHYEVEPLIVLDTSNATIDMDNENDNAEAGKAIAYIKQNLGSACLWVVAHTSKVASRDDVKQMSARGAGAFEGDANAVAYIINVEEVRFMVLGKRRFEADFTEVRFESEAHFETVKTPWGSEQKVWYRFGVPRIAEKGERESMKEQIKEEATVEQRLVMHREIMQVLSCGEWMSGSKVRSKVKGKTETITGMLKTLVDTGRLEVKQGDRNATLFKITPAGTTGNN